MAARVDRAMRQDEMAGQHPTPDEADPVFTTEEGRAHNTAEDITTPPADSGKDAWLFLVACVVVESMVWGFPLAFGLFQHYYTTHEPFSKDAPRVAVIGDTALGLLYFGGLVVCPAIKKWPMIVPYLTWSAFPLYAIGLLAASFARNVNELIATQGVLTCFGGWFIFYPTFTLLDQWFVRRKGLAYGTMQGATGLTGIVTPYALNYLLNTYGSQTTLRVWAVIMALTTPFAYWIKPRIPLKRSSRQWHAGMSFFREKIFWAIVVAMIVQSTGFPIPSVYLPTYVVYLDYSISIGTLVVVLFNVVSMVATLAWGRLVDIYDVGIVLALVTAGSMVAVFVFWGCAVSLAMLILFSLVYGLTASGFSGVAVAGTILKLKKSDDTDVGMLLAIILAARGVGIICSGPISEALYLPRSWQDGDYLAYSTGFGPLIIFTGLTALIGVLPWVGQLCRWWR